MRKILAILSLCPVLIFGQTGSGSQSIELPDFVITGVQNVRLPFIKKAEPKLISVLSKEFFTPQFSTEKFAPSDISTPKKLNIVLIEDKPRSHGKLSLGGGIFSLPVGRLDLDWNFDGGLIGANVWGRKELDYIDYAGSNSSGGEIASKFFINNSADFMAGAVISANAGFSQSTFNFFAAPNHERQRQIMSIHGKASLEKDYLSVLNFGLELSPEYSRLKNEGFSETNLHISSFVKLRFPGFGIRGTVNLLQQKSDFNGLGTSASYISGRGFAYAIPVKALSLKGGIFYSSFEGDFVIRPFASATLEFSDNISITTELNSRTEFYSAAALLRMNRFFDLKTDNHLNDIKVDLSSAVKYEFLTYFEIHAGAQYLTADNYLFFEDLSLSGDFEALGQNGAEKIRGFANVLFNPGPLGYFYGGIEYQSVTGAAGWQLPYHPNFSAELEYGAKFNFGLDLTVGYDLKSGIYADLKNFSKLPDYHNAYLKLKYNLSSKFGIGVEFSNLLNKKNYLLYQYEEKPFDAVGTVVYSW